MTLLLLFIAWCCLFALSAPIALAALLVLPVLWLIALPFMLLFWLLKLIFGVVIGGVLLAFFGALLAGTLAFMGLVAAAIWWPLKALAGRA